MTPARFESHGRNAQKSTGPPIAWEGSIKDDQTDSLGISAHGGWAVCEPLTSANTLLGLILIRCQR